MTENIENLIAEAKWRAAESEHNPRTPFCFMPDVEVFSALADALLALLGQPRTDEEHPFHRMRSNEITRRMNAHYIRRLDNLAIEMEIVADMVGANATGIANFLYHAQARLGIYIKQIQETGSIRGD